MPRRPSPGPRLKGPLRYVWRSAEVLQVGLGEHRARLLVGLSAADLAALTDVVPGLVDHRGHAPKPPRRAAADSDQGQRRERLTALLGSAGLLLTRPTDPAQLATLGHDRSRLAEDAAVWSLLDAGSDGWPRLLDRRRRHVVLAGPARAGRTAIALADRLRAAGVGTVTTRATGGPDNDSDNDSDDGSGDGADDGSGAVDLVVLLDRDAADAARAEPLLLADVPHLSLVLGEDTTVVGPLVRPGSSACLRCLDLHRADADPAWPRVLAQLVGPAAARAGRTHPEEATLASLAASLAALQVLGHLDGVRPADPAPPAPAAAGATLEVRLPDGLTVRRTWPAHPDCGCHWPPAGSAVAVAVTMGW